MEENKKPFDRKDVFVLAFRQHYGVILGVSVMLFAFALPALAVFVLSYIELYLMGEITAETAAQMYALQARMYLWLIPAFAVFSVGAAGAFYTIRRLVWGEDIRFFADFFRGVRSNGVQSVVSGVLFIVFCGALSYTMNLLSLNAALGSAYWVLSVVQVFLLVAACIVLLFQYAIIAVYRDRMWRIVKNSFALTWMSLPRSVLIFLLMLLPVFLLLAFSKVYFLYILVLLFLALVGLGYAILLFTLHAHGVFDKYINKHAFPQIYKKGLYHEGTGIDYDPTDYTTPASNMDVE